MSHHVTLTDIVLRPRKEVVVLMRKTIMTLTVNDYRNLIAVTNLARERLHMFGGKHTTQDNKVAINSEDVCFSL